MSRRSLATAAMALIVLAVGIRAHADLLVKLDTSVVRYDEVSGAFLGAFAQGVGGPGLTFGHEGNLYVSDDELLSFPQSQHDDFVDATVFALTALDRKLRISWGLDQGSGQHWGRQLPHEQAEDHEDDWWHC